MGEVLSILGVFVLRFVCWRKGRSSRWYGMSQVPGDWNTSKSSGDD